VIYNQLTIDGVICRAPKRSKSVAGIPHCQFVIEHRSQQVEADLPRQTYARMQVVVSGQKLQSCTQDLCQGGHVRVSGFINRHESRDGQSTLVLHAQNIERFS